MAIDVVFAIPLAPMGKERPRFAKPKAGDKAPRIFTAKDTRSFESWVSLLAAQRFPRGTKIDEAVRIDIAAIAERPQDVFGEGVQWRPKKPDGDNVRKLILDGLKSVLENDARVVGGETLCLYAERGGKPRVVVRIRSEARDPGAAALALGILLSERGVP